MRFSKKGIMVAIIALMALTTVTSVLAAKPLKYNVQHDINAVFYQKIVDGRVEEWAWGKCNLMLMPEKEIVSFHAILETADGETVNYRLKDYIGIRYYPSLDVWFINGIYEVKYGDEIYTTEAKLSYSVKRNRVGTVYFPDLCSDIWEKGTSILPPFEP